MSTQSAKKEKPKTSNASPPSAPPERSSMIIEEVPSTPLTTSVIRASNPPPATVPPTPSTQATLPQVLQLPPAPRAQSPESPHAPRRKRAFEKIKEQAVFNFPDYADSIFIHNYLKELSHEICSFCGGRGHLPHTCASKKNVDVLMRETGNGQAWAHIKSTKRTETAKIRREARRRYIDEN